MSRMNDLQYINRVIRGLQGVKKKEGLYNFKCNVCGDGTHGNTRGYFYVNKKKTGYSFVCHNCGEGSSFSDWLKDYDYNLFQEYLYEIMSEKRELSVFAKKLVDKTPKVEYNEVVTNKPTFNKGDKNENIYECTIEDCPDEFTTGDEIRAATTSNEIIARDAQGSRSSMHVQECIQNPTNGLQTCLSKPTFARPDFSGTLVDCEIQDLSEFESDVKLSQIKRPNLDKLRKISELDDTHGAKKYITKRLIPEPFHDRMYLVWKFYRWCNEWKKESFKQYIVDTFDEPRLIIPFYDKEGSLVMIQGRSFKKDAKVKYFTIKCDDDFPKIYGLDRIDYDKIVQVWEGPIDSMFGDNAVAMAGADANPSQFFDDYVTIYDNEPRSAEIGRRLAQEIKRGGKVVIWPSYITEKDANDMVMSGISKEKLNKIVRDNTFSGLEAELKFSQWNKRSTKKIRTNNSRNKPSFNI